MITKTNGEVYYIPVLGYDLVGDRAWGGLSVLSASPDVCIRGYAVWFTTLVITSRQNSLETRFRKQCEYGNV